MISISYNKLKLAGILYAAVPAVIFFFGWLSLPCAVIFSLMLAAAVFFSIRKFSDSDGEHKTLEISRGNFFALAVISFLWCFFAGQGGFVHQSSDHIIRNEIIRDLISRPWPVTYGEGEHMLSYYIAHWMGPTAVGKLVYLLSGSLRAGYLTGNILLLLRSGIGCFIVLLLTAMITNTGKKTRALLSAFMFIFFSGLDVIGVIIRGDIGSTHFEWWADYFQYSSNTTCLFWVYNQTVVAWIITLCIINEKKIKDFAFLGLLAFPYGPFPFVGIVVMCLIKAAVPLARLFKTKSRNEAKAYAADVFSPQNILTLLSIAPVYILYYTSNVIISDTAAVSSGGAVSTGFRFHSVFLNAAAAGNTETVVDFAVKYILLLVLEFGIYAALLFRYKRRDPVFIGMCVSLVIIPLFQIGYKYDFSMRTSIPALVYICISFISFVQSEIPERKESGGLDAFVRAKPLLTVGLMVFVLGAVDPFMEFEREISSSFFVCGYNPGFDYSRSDSLDDGGVNANFYAVNYKESDFYKYICKK